MSDVLRRAVTVVATIVTALLLTPATAAAQCTGGLANALGISGNDTCGGAAPAIGAGVAVATALGAAAVHATVTYVRGAASAVRPSLPNAGLARSAGRVGAVRDMFDLQRTIAIYNALGNTPHKVRIHKNDRVHKVHNAHTLDKHSAELPQYLSDAPGEKTIEGRIYADESWDDGDKKAKKATWSFRWKDHGTMNRTINDYIQTNWELIRNELALYGDHAAMFDTGRLAGEGFGNKSMFESLVPEAVYAQSSHVRVLLKLDPDDISSFFVVTAFPAKTPPKPRMG